MRYSYWLLFVLSSITSAIAQDTIRVVTPHRDSIKIVVPQSDSVQVKTNFKTVVRKSDTTYWQRSFVGNLNFNQASFSNWSGGGTNSIALGGVITARALYQRGRMSWDNTADLQLGYSRQAGLTLKTSDQVVLISVLGVKVASKWDLIGSAYLSTFFAPGYRYDNLPADRVRLRIANFLTPAQLTLALGISYKPTTWFAVRMSPFAPRLTYIADQGVRVRQDSSGLYVPDPTAAIYGVPPGQNLRGQVLAFQIQTVFNRSLTENIALSTRYQFFSEYARLRNAVHRLDLTFTAKINRYLSTTFNLIGLYDRDFSDKLQIQQTLALGLVYNVSNFRPAKKQKEDSKTIYTIRPGRF
jgi:hypothetical protein